MKILPKLALLAAIVPAAAERCLAGHMTPYTEPPAPAASEIPGPAFPVDSGFGSGTWRLGAAGDGLATAELFDTTGRLRYVVRASLVRSGEFPPAGMPEQGGFHGALLVVKDSGVREVVALVEGTWIREPNGAGAFGANILVPDKDRPHTIVPIGTIEGTMRGPMGMSQLHHVGRGESQGASTLGRLALTWNLEK